MLLVHRLILLSLLFKIIFDLLKAFVIITLLFAGRVFEAIMFKYLLITDEFLLVDLLLNGLLLLAFFPCEFLLLASDLFEVLKIVFLFVLLCPAVIFHLLHQFLFHTLLVLAQLRLYGVLLPLELLYVVHNDLGPIVIALLGSKT